MKALSIRQPWAWGIVHAGKDVENREWYTNYRGRVLIHASKYKPRQEDIDDFNNVFMDAVPTDERVKITKRHTCFGEVLSMERGGIIGVAEMVDCVVKSSSPWFFGRYGFVLHNPRPLTFTPYKGALGFFDVPEIDEPSAQQEQ